MFDSDMARELSAKIDKINREVGEVNATMKTLRCPIHDKAIQQLQQDVAEDRGRRGVLTVAVSMIVSAIVAIGIAVISALVRGK